MTWQFDSWNQVSLIAAGLEDGVPVAAVEGISRVQGYIHRENGRMRQMCSNLGFEIRYREDLELLEAVYLYEDRVEEEKLVIRNVTT